MRGKRRAYHVGAEEDGIAEDDDDAGVLERPGEPEPRASLGAQRSFFRISEFQF